MIIGEKSKLSVFGNDVRKEMEPNETVKLHSLANSKINKVEFLWKAYLIEVRWAPYCSLILNAESIIQ